MRGWAVAACLLATVGAAGIQAQGPQVPDPRALEAPPPIPIGPRVPDALDAPPPIPVTPDGSPQPRFFTDACERDCATNWQATSPGDDTAALVNQQPVGGVGGSGCAQVLWARTMPDTVLRFDRAVPASAALEELTASLAVFTQHRCAVAVRITFPKAFDPNTGDALRTWIASTPQPARADFAWRTLTIGTTEAAVNDARRRVRLTLERATAPQTPSADDDAEDADEPANLAGAIVDRAGVFLWTDGGGVRGRAGVRVDDLRIGPLVAVSSASKTAEAEPRFDPYVREPEPKRRAMVRSGRMTVDGEPFFPRLTFSHGVDPRALAGAGFNLVQVLDWRDRDLLERIAAAGLGAVAQPPSPGEAGAGPADLNAPADSGLAPFGRATDPIWLWNLGPRIPGQPAWVAATEAWVDAVRAADAARDRPILIGVTGSERAYSRFADLLGVSRMVLGTALPLWEHTALLREAADRKARPGEPLFTWIQTAPHGRTAAMREAAGLEPAVLEPELITRQALGAVAAGVKGIGYWITEPLDDATPARTERRLALTLTNLQLAAVEPVLASATKVAPLRVVPVTTGDPASVNRVRGQFGAEQNLLLGAPIGSRNTRGVGPGGSYAFGQRFGARETLSSANEAVDQTGASDARPAGRATGALLNSGADRLVVAVWHGLDDQFVPGPAPFTSATFTVPGALPTAAAWRITPTAVTTVPHEQVTGGMRVTVPNFGDGAVVLITANFRGADHLRRRVAKLAPSAATAAVQLARLKIERTRDTDARLRSRTFDPRWIDAHLYAAESKLRDAERMLKLHDWDRARVAAELARRFARAVQRAHWDRLSAEAGLAGEANGSPHLIAFSTLPDHVELLRRLAAARRGRPVALLTPTDSARSAALPLLGDDETESADRPEFDGKVRYTPPASVAAAAVLNDGELRLTAQTKAGYNPPTLLERGLVIVESAAGGRAGGARGDRPRGDQSGRPDPRQRRGRHRAR